MGNSLNFKNKIILTILLSFALGVVSLLSDNKTNNKLTEDLSLEKDNFDDKTSLNCDPNYKSDLSLITENQKEKNNDSCLFIGCSGVNF